MSALELGERLRAEPAGTITEAIKTFVADSPLNRMPSTRELVIFGEPLVRFADGDDPLYTKYKAIISEEHLTPREAVALAGIDVSAKLSVVSYVLPIVEETRLSNRLEKEVPSRRWSHTRYYGELFNEALRQHVVDVLTGAGYVAVSPSLQPYFRTLSNERIGVHSVWSERHTAFAAGHGTFGLSDGFITTERGIAHRCGSVITDLPLPASGRVATDPYGNCVYYTDGTCKACAARCPAGAISEAGHDKRKCMGYLRHIGYLPVTAYNDETSVYGCGLCQTKVPCEYRIPAKVVKLRTSG